MSSVVNNIRSGSVWRCIKNVYRGRGGRRFPIYFSGEFYKSDSPGCITNEHDEECLWVGARWSEFLSTFRIVPKNKRSGCLRRKDLCGETRLT